MGNSEVVQNKLEEKGILLVAGNMNYNPGTRILPEKFERIEVFTD